MKADNGSVTDTRKTSYHTCNLCEAMCGIAIETDGEQILSIKGDKNDPFSRGHICPKATALQDLYEDPERLTKPLEKTEHGWTTISWDEAFDKVVSRIQRIQAQYGKDAVATYLGNPNVHNTGGMLYGRHLLHTLNTKNMYSATSVDQLPHHIVASKLFGHMLKIPVPDIDRTDFFLMLGANPVASNGSLMTVADVKTRLKDIQKKGGKVVVVDPRRTETAELADQHYFIKPGTDALLMLAMLYVIFESSLLDAKATSLMSNEIEGIQEDVLNYSPERVAPIVGIDAVEIRRLTYQFTEAKRPVCYGRMGTSVQAFGTLTQYLITVFNLLLGRVDKVGGLMFSSPAIDLMNLTSRGGFDRNRSRIRNLPDFNSEFPVSTLAEEILTPGEGQIKALLVAGGNPILSTPNGEQLDKALGELEFMVSVDFYLTETSRHADFILPPVSPLERDHYDLAFNMLAIRNVAKFSPALFKAPKHAKQDWEIYCALTERLLKKAPLKQRLQLKLTEALGVRGQLDLLLRTGRYGNKLNPFKGLSLKKLLNNPHGVDLGPLQPQLPKSLRTKSKCVELNRDFFMKDLHRIEKTYFSEASQYDQTDKLLLIGRRHVRSNNSWLHNSHRLVKGKSRCTVMINPQDTQRLNLEDGQLVDVTSTVGNIQLSLEVTDHIMPGVVSIPHGWGHTKTGSRWTKAEQHSGQSVNALTDDSQVDELSGNAVLNGVPVTVRAASDPKDSLTLKAFQKAPKKKTKKKSVSTENI
ncbi:molybdopterin oxidoreductase family protein [Litoribrevibacter albus]|uniref:Oxidoreductase n=1 Tax=Litoribrevibacter albus TaxID=1473156 RepID=A0AA37S9J0_9GAMM|nr:molybdopterin oxidoreductase family protein [Litoribrevibacter albus]GLQ30811.1 oxidoreductase [Litoribrevibacter albus]